LFFPSVSSVLTKNFVVPETTSGNIDLSSDIGFHSAVGFKSSSFWRAELELVGNKNSAKDIPGSTFSQVSAMFNGYYDLSTGSKFTPYVAAGVGYGMTYANGITAGSGLAYQLKAGAEYEIADRTSIYLQYRYLKSPEGKIIGTGAVDGDIQTYNPSYSSIEFGTRYSF
jgi:opacity protein-like surface antigen